MENGISEMHSGASVLITSRKMEIGMSVSLLKKFSPGEDLLGDRYHHLTINYNLKRNPRLPYEKTMPYLQLKNVIKVLGE